MTSFRYFSLKVVNGLSYRIRAWVNMPDGSQRHVEPVTILATGPVKGVKLDRFRAGRQLL